MKVSERRKEIVNILLSAKEPISGSELANRFNISRQIIVQDIAELKKIGYDINSTSKGYIMQKSPLAERIFKLRHTTEQTEDELSCIIELGGTVVDVFVWHKVYGKIEATLNISSQKHINQFLEGVRTGQSTELMHITGGYHYHTVRADNESTLDRIEAALNKRKYIVPEI